MQLSLQFGYFKHLITFVPCFDVKYVTNHFPPSMINSYFTNNTANRDGGVINMDLGTVSNCNFVDNKTAAGVLGGGGGGRLTLAQGAGKNADKMDEAIQTAVDLIKG